MRPVLRISVDSNQSIPGATEEVCVHQLFEQQVRCAPHATAIISEEHQLTYAIVNARANQLAHHLRRLGVGKEVLVGICLIDRP